MRAGTHSKKGGAFPAPQPNPIIIEVWLRLCMICLFVCCYFCPSFCVSASHDASGATEVQSASDLLSAAEGIGATVATHIRGRSSEPTPPRYFRAFLHSTTSLKDTMLEFRLGSTNETP